jgi:hypothetical protein
MTAKRKRDLEEEEYVPSKKQKNTNAEQEEPNKSLSLMINVPSKILKTVLTPISKKRKNDSDSVIPPPPKKSRTNSSPRKNVQEIIEINSDLESDQTSPEIAFVASPSKSLSKLSKTPPNSEIAQISNKNTPTINNFSEAMDIDDSDVESMDVESESLYEEQETSALKYAATLTKFLLECH